MSIVVWPVMQHVLLVSSVALVAIALQLDAPLVALVWPAPARRGCKMGRRQMWIVEVRPASVGACSNINVSGQCEKCTVGSGCGNNADCSSGVCLDSACVAASCTDGVKNGGEAGVDCGGPDCSAG